MKGSQQEVNQHKLIIHLRLLKTINDTASLNNSSVVSNVYTPTIPQLNTYAASRHSGIPIQGLMVGALSGLSAAAGVIVGKRLGRKEYDEAYTESKKIMYAGLFGAVTVSALLILLAGVYTGLYRVDDSVKELGRTLLIVFALYAPVKVSIRDLWMQGSRR